MFKPGLFYLPANGNGIGDSLYRYQANQPGIVPQDRGRLLNQFHLDCRAWKQDVCTFGLYLYQVHVLDVS